MESHRVSKYRRLPPYLYLTELYRGRRMLEISSGNGAGANYLAQNGASWVLGVDRSQSAVESARNAYRRPNLEFQVADYGSLDLEDGSFDVICVPEGAELVRWLGFLEEARRVLAEEGQVMVTVPSGDRRQSRRGVKYHDLVDALEPLFGRVRMFAMSPFVGFSMVEFAEDDAELPELELDTSMASAGEGTEGVLEYVAVAGARPTSLRGYTVVQLPAVEGLDAIVEVFGEADGAGGAGRRSGEAGGSALSEHLAQTRGGLGDDADARRRLVRSQDKLAEAQSEIDALNARIARAEEEIGRVTADAAGELASTRQEAEAARRRASEAEGQVREAETKAREAEAKVRAAESRAREVESRVREVESRASAAESRAGETGSRISDAEARAKKAQALTAAAETRANAAETRAGSAETRLAAAQARVSALEARANEAESKSVAALERESTARAQAAAAAGVELERIRIRNAELERASARLATQRQELEWKVTELEGQLQLGEPPPPSPTVLAQAAAIHEKEMKEKTAQLAERDSYVAELREELARVQAAREAALQEQKKARSIAESLEGDLKEVRSRAARAEGELLRLGQSTKTNGLQPPLEAGWGSDGESSQPPSQLPPDGATAQRVVDLQTALREQTEATEKAVARWKETEAKSDELWRKIGEMQTELETSRAQAVENARAQRQAAQTALARAMEEASKKLISVVDEAARTEKERQELERVVKGLRQEIEGAKASLPAAANPSGLHDLHQQLAALEDDLRGERARLAELEEGLGKVNQIASAAATP
ncbi:MAG: methyltransferase domain-containing protein [Pseudomonadota bacterium]